MAPVVEASGTQTMTPGTEHTLATSATAKTRQVVVDLINLVQGESVVVYIKRKCLSTGVVRIMHEVEFTHAQGAPIKFSPPYASPHGIEVSMMQVGGTGRNIDWSVETLD